MKSKHVEHVTFPELEWKTTFKNTILQHLHFLWFYPSSLQMHTLIHALHKARWGKGALGSHGRLSANLVQEMPTFPAWPRSRRPLAKFSSAMGHSALGTNALSRSFISTQQGAAGKARIWRLSFFRAATASLHLENIPPYHHWVILKFTTGTTAKPQSSAVTYGSTFSGNV